MQYNELVAVLGATSGLPPDYQVFVPEAKALGDWLTKGKKLSKSFKDEIQRLVESMATSGSHALRWTLCALLQPQDCYRTRR